MRPKADCFTQQLFANVWFGLQQTRRPLTRITYPLGKHKVTAEKVFFALEPLLDALRIEEAQHLLLFDAILLIFQPSNA
jgi:hypothetical protein